MEGKPLENEGKILPNPKPEKNMRKIKTSEPTAKSLPLCVPYKNHTFRQMPAAGGLELAIELLLGCRRTGARRLPCVETRSNS